MISSASNSQQYGHASGTSSGTNVSSNTSSSVQSSQSTQSTHSVSTGSDQLEAGSGGFRNAWARQLEERNVQGSGVATEHQRVENARQSQQTQTVADLLSQERQKKV